MKYESTSDKPNSSDKKLLSWDELLKKGALLKDTIQRLSLTPDRPYLVTKSCTDGTFQKGDLLILVIMVWRQEEKVIISIHGLLMKA